MIKNMGKDKVIISLTENELLDTIANFKALKSMMQNIVRKANGSNTKQGTEIWDEWICPCCGSRYEVEYDKYDYCPNCGQRIDWTEENESEL